jgi:hypothetical protein
MGEDVSHTLIRLPRGTGEHIASRFLLVREIVTPENLEMSERM